MSDTLTRTVLGAELPPQLDATASAQGAGTPSNNDVLEAAKAAYGAHQEAVDALTTALVADVVDPGLGPARDALDATRWSTATAAVVAPFVGSAPVRAALQVAGSDAAVRAVSVGAFTTQGPRDGGPEVPGFLAPVPLSDDRSGVVLQLDLFRGVVKVTPGQNLQYGLWLDPAPAGGVVGFYISTGLNGIAVNLKILLGADLRPRGFLSSTGARVPVDTGVFAGTVQSWTPERGSVP